MHIDLTPKINYLKHIGNDEFLRKLLAILQDYEARFQQDLEILFEHENRVRVLEKNKTPITKEDFKAEKEAKVTVTKEDIIKEIKTK